MAPLGSIRFRRFSYPNVRRVSFYLSRQPLEFPLHINFSFQSVTRSSYLFSDLFLVFSPAFVLPDPFTRPIPRQLAPPPARSTLLSDELLRPPSLEDFLSPCVRPFHRDRGKRASTSLEIDRSTSSRFPTGSHRSSCSVRVELVKLRVDGSTADCSSVKPLINSTTLHRRESTERSLYDSVANARCRMNDETRIFWESLVPNVSPKVSTFLEAKENSVVLH